MIVRYKKSSGEIVDLLANASELDYWVDTQKSALYIQQSGEKAVLVAKSKMEKRLFTGLDRIYAAVKTDGFADVSSLL